MRALLIAFLLLPLATFADEVRIAVGMSAADIPQDSKSPY